MTDNTMRAAALKPEDGDTEEGWAPEKIWLQYGQGEGGSHTWCEDSQSPECDEAEYVRSDAFAAALAAARAEGYKAGMERAAEIADGFHCGTCGMDGKIGNAIRAEIGKEGM